MTIRSILRRINKSARNNARKGRLTQQGLPYFISADMKKALLYVPVDVEDYSWSHAELLMRADHVVVVRATSSLGEMLGPHSAGLKMGGGK